MSADTPLPPLPPTAPIPPAPTGAPATPAAGILLAAGTASRMGRNKLLLDLDGESLLRRAARRALEAGLAPLLVVLGHQEELARRELVGLPCAPVLNPLYRQGMSTSLQAGVAALPATTSAAVVLLADMPFVTAAMLAALVERYRQTRAPLVISDYAGVQAPPMLYDRALFAEVLAMDGGRCGKQLAARHRHEAEVLAWPVAALADLDVPDDYAALTATAHRSDEGKG